MNIRPLFIWAVFFALGVFLSQWVYMPLWLLFLVLAGLFIARLLLKEKGGVAAIWLAGVLFLCGGILRGGMVLYPPYSYAPGCEH